MTLWFIIALVAWAAMVPLAIWLVSRIARSGLTPQDGHVRVHFLWKDKGASMRRPTRDADGDVNEHAQ